jgi:hypothetical protein
MAVLQVAELLELHLAATLQAIKPGAQFEHLPLLTGGAA